MLANFYITLDGDDRIITECTSFQRALYLAHAWCESWEHNTVITVVLGDYVEEIATIEFCTMP